MRRRGEDGDDSGLMDKKQCLASKARERGWLEQLRRRHTEVPWAWESTEH